MVSYIFIKNRINYFKKFELLKKLHELLIREKKFEERRIYFLIKSPWLCQLRSNKNQIQTPISLPRPSKLKKLKQLKELNKKLFMNVMKATMRQQKLQEHLMIAI